MKVSKKIGLYTSLGMVGTLYYLSLFFLGKTQDGGLLPAAIVGGSIFLLFSFVAVMSKAAADQWKIGPLGPIFHLCISGGVLWLGLKIMGVIANIGGGWEYWLFSLPFFIVSTAFAQNE